MNTNLDFVVRYPNMLSPADHCFLSVPAKLSAAQNYLKSITQQLAAHLHKITAFRPLEQPLWLGKVPISFIIIISHSSSTTTTLLTSYPVPTHPFPISKTQPVR